MRRTFLRITPEHTAKSAVYRMFAKMEGGCCQVMLFTMTYIILENGGKINEY